MVLNPPGYFLVLPFLFFAALGRINLYQLFPNMLGMIDETLGEVVTFV